MKFFLSIYCDLWRYDPWVSSWFHGLFILAVLVIRHFIRSRRIQREKGFYDRSHR